MSYVIGLIQAKGGGAKTTTADTLALWLALTYPDKRIGLLDTCKEHHSTDWIVSREENGYPELLEFDATPSPALVGRKLKKMMTECDIIVVDGKPDIDEMMQNTVALCDTIIIPVKPSKPDLASAIRTASYLLSAPTKPDARIAFLRTAWTSTHAIAKIINDGLIAANAEVGLPIIETIIEARTAWVTSIGVGSTVHEWEPNGTAAQEATKAFIEIMELSQ